ncbi:MAG: hypothetical protein Q6351_004885 [Candidatus Njordarchaeum guaymaensis]
MTQEEIKTTLSEEKPLAYEDKYPRLTILDPYNNVIVSGDINWHEDRPYYWYIPEYMIEGTYTAKVEVDTGPLQGEVSEQDTLNVGEVAYSAYVGLANHSSGQYGVHPGIPLNSDNTVLSVPNMIYGSGWRSFAIVTNVGTTTASGTIHYYDSDGDGSEITSEAFTLEPHAWEVVKWNDIVTNYGIDRGSVVINSSQPITAYVGLGNYTPGQYAAHAAIPLNSDNTSLSVPNMIQGCGWRSFAIVTNVGNTTASGTIHYYNSDGDGSEITSEAFTLEPHAWEVVKWNNIVTNYGIDRGSVVIESSQPITAYVGLANHSSGQYGVHPGISLNSDNTVISVPNMIYGSGWRSFAIVTNVGNTTASGTIHYYDSNGDGSEITSEAFTLAPHAWEVVKWNDIVTNYGIDRGSVVIE